MGDESADVAKYRARAEEMRAEAQHVKDPEAMKAMLSIADNYEKLASAIERRLRG